MPSPFPGMDPYLERPDLWSLAHGLLLVSFNDALNRTLPFNYVACYEQYVWLYSGDDGSPWPFRPDIAITPRFNGKSGPLKRAKVKVRTGAAPLEVLLPRPRALKTRYVKILDNDLNRVITVLELLSPDNKSAGRGRRKYIAKRDGFRISDVNWVEIDLLRAGRRLDLGEPPPPKCDYYVLVSPVATAPKAMVWTFSVRDELPEIPIPLKPNEPPVTLALRPCLDQMYDRGRFAGMTQYSRDPDPPLRKADAAWAKQLLKEKGAIG